MRDERRLVRRAARGDRDAFTTIFRRFQQDLYRYCVGILGNSEDAQDALQNTMVKALGALPGERREIDLKPWLYRIAHNESIDLIRRRRQTVPLEDDGFPAGASLADEVEMRHRLRQLLADVGELPERQRGALLMREAGGLEFEEIASALGTTPGVARQTLYEARLGLREMDAGRNMNCIAVTKALSDGDRRSRRRRDISAHLKACPECRLFAEEIDSRKRALASISPLPALAAAALLQGLAGGGGGSGAAAASGTSAGAGVTGAVAGKAIGTATLLKGAATIAAVAAIGVGGADVGGFLQGHDGPSKAPAEPKEGSGRAAEPQSQMTREESAGQAAPADRASARRTALDRIAFDRPRSDRPGHGRVNPGVARARSSAAASDQTGPPAASARPAPTSLPVGDAAASEPAPGNSAVEHPHGPGHTKQLPAAAAHGQETAAAAKEKGKSASAPGHSEKGDEAPDPAAESHPTHPEHPAKPSHPETSEPSPAAAVPAETETPPPAEPAAGEGEPQAAEGAAPGEHKGKT